MNPLKIIVTEQDFAKACAAIHSESIITCCPIAQAAKRMFPERVWVMADTWLRSVGGAWECEDARKITDHFWQRYVKDGTCQPIIAPLLPLELTFTPIE